MKSVIIFVLGLLSSISFASGHFSSCGQRGKHGEVPKYVIMDEKPTIENLVTTMKSNKSKEEKRTDLTQQMQTIANESDTTGFCAILVENLPSKGAGYLEKCKRALIDKENIDTMAEEGIGEMTDMTLVSCQLSLVIQMMITGF